LTVLGDERGLRILLRNLLDNALKYSGPLARAVELKLEMAGGSALLSVRDHGPGIAENALPHVFEPFYRADAARTRGAGGFGLGLHLAQRIAVAHGGELKVENMTDGGARFSLRLPLLNERFSAGN
jgi:two-component system sensor histidine kinase MtrB